MKGLTFRVAALLLALGGAACTSGTETGNPPGEQAVTIMALERETTTQALSLGEAWLALHRLSLVPCAADAAVVSTVDYPVDLFADPPARATFETAVSDYCGVRIEIAPSPSATPEELTGLSAFISGTRSDDLPFEVRSTEQVTFDFDAGTALDAAHLVLAVDPEPWFVDADVHGATTTPDGIALIDADNNPDILAAFEGDTALAIALYVDADGDGALAGDELTPVATAH